MKRAILSFVMLIGMTAAALAQQSGSGAWNLYALSITPAATAAAIGVSQQTFTIPNLTTAMDVIVSQPVPTALCPATGGRVSAANTVQIDFATLTAAACTPAAGTYFFLIRNR